MTVVKKYRKSNQRGYYKGYKIKGVVFHTKVDIAREYGVTANSIDRWVRDRRTPDGDILRVIDIVDPTIKSVN